MAKNVLKSGSARPGAQLPRRSFAVLAGAAGMALLAGCAVDRSAPEAAPSARPKPENMVVVGDSLSTGFGTSAADAWPNLINNDPDDAAKWALANVSQNGCGYVTVGDHNSTFGAQVAQTVKADTRLVLFFGSENDMGNDPTAIGTAATAAFALARAKSPHAVLVVVGPPAYTEQPETDRLAVRDAIGDAATAAGATFVDPIAERWIVGESENLIGPDGDHPSVAGQHYLKGKMENLITAGLAQAAGPAQAAGR